MVSAVVSSKYTSVTIEAEAIAPVKHGRLQESVAQAVRRYLSAMGQSQSADLHRLVIQEVEKPLLSEVMHFCQYNQTQAALLLGLTRTTLRKKLHEYQLDNN